MSHRAVREMIKLAQSEGLKVQASGITGATHIWLDVHHPHADEFVRRFHCSFSSGDQRALMNNRAMFRRFFRELEDLRRKGVPADKLGEAWSQSFAQQR